MPQRSATDYLIRTVLDDAFREQALADPAGAMAGYDLTEDEIDILRCRDDRLLALLGGSVREETVPDEPGVAAKKATAQAASQPTLPPVELLLRLTPQTTLAEDGTPQVLYAASLQSWPLSTDAGSNNRGEGKDDGESQISESPEITWLIRLAPTVVASEATGLRVAYSATIHPVDLSSPQEQMTSHETVLPALQSPWKHDVESAAVKTAAKVVLASRNDQRYEKLLALIQVMQAGDHRG